jgi:hypothetical protein
MGTTGISRLDYEKLPADVKVKAHELFRELKGELRDAQFSLRFLELDAIQQPLFNLFSTSFQSLFNLFSALSSF